MPVRKSSYFVEACHTPVPVAAGDWKNWGGQEENQSTVSCYFIQVNYLSLLSYIHWKLSNKTMTYKTSLRNILLNGKRLLLAVDVWKTQLVNIGWCVSSLQIMYGGLIYKKIKNTNVYPFRDLIPSRLCGRQLLYPLCYRNVLCPGCSANLMYCSRMNETKTMNYLSDRFSLISLNSFFSFRNLFIFPLKPIPTSLKTPYFLSVHGWQWQL